MYENLINSIRAAIKANGNEEITGPILQDVLVGMVNALGAGVPCGGVLSPGNTPAPQQPIFYLAGPGVYNAAGLTTVAVGCIGIAIYNGSSWTSSTIDTGLGAAVSTLVAALAEKIDKVPTATAGNVAEFDSQGSVKDSGIASSSLAKGNGRYPAMISGSTEGIINPIPAIEFFTYQQTAAGQAGTGAAQIQTIKGRTLVWNQIIPTIASSWTAAYGRPITLGTNSMKCEWSGSVMYANDLYVVVPITYKLLAAHKYYMAADVFIEGNTNSVLFSVAYGGEINADGRIYSSSKATSGHLANIAQPQADNTLTRLYFNFTNASAANISSGTKVTFSNIQICDLTNIFGAGNEPSTVAEFEALFSESYYANNPETILPLRISGLVSKDSGDNVLATLSLPIIGKTAKDGNGNPIVPFPEGMHGTPTVYDVATKDGGSIKWGVRAYEAGDESDATVITDGTNTIYQLDTPVDFTWDEPLPLNYPVNRLGTEMLEPTGVDENGVPQTAPLTAEIIYPIDALGKLLGLPQDFISAASFKNYLDACVAAGAISGYTMTFNQTTKQYDFTIN